MQSRCLHQLSGRNQPEADMRRQPAALQRAPSFALRVPHDRYRPRPDTDERLLQCVLMNCKTFGHILDGQDDSLLIDCGGDHFSSVGATEAEAGDDEPQGGPTGGRARDLQNAPRQRGAVAACKLH